MDGKVQDCTMFAGSVGVQFVDGKSADPSTGIYIHHILSSNVKKREAPWFSNCNTPNRASGNVNGITGGGGFLSTGEDSASVCLFRPTSKALLTHSEGESHVYRCQGHPSHRLPHQIY
jgi:hypothetical protein